MESHTTQIQKRLLDWFSNNGRHLPWREKSISEVLSWNADSQSVMDRSPNQYFTSSQIRDPYIVVVSEFMLQQTQVDRVLPKFLAFIQRWPNFKSLSEAKLSEVIIEWKGLGYNRRARFLHEIAKIVTTQLNGTSPSTLNNILKLPGIGEYTARAILAFSFQHDVGVIDTNIRRIFLRVFYGVEFTTTTSTISPAQFAKEIDNIVPHKNGDQWNQMLMDFGSLVCRSKTPQCNVCPIQNFCSANTRAKAQDFMSYSVLLSDQIKEKRANETRSPSNHPKNPRFETTDRYFRGKIIDLLREHPHEMQMLWETISNVYALHDRVRFGRIIEALVSDKMITIRRTQVQLAE
ncbi:MAG: HhH-GPD [Microgenomates group bacterium GW2011_GWF2_45_18]|nr:MAG: HhH-GPD [Microgenomates group bacterium GW2011_GWF1_44_10]KKU01946.1 MAG: HhH-GPD [Microgenomates group bacterium GW2011_GWF2_45_18]HAU98741.1 hypothetical protein [Candidatus Paceibacterota bacterium]HAX01439.1 hypothetical protein [Candidatus Paceibacterota bacterium]